MVTCVPGGRARSALVQGPGARFADIRWVAETGSTNADAMALAREGAPEGVVVVADHQTAGRGRAGRTWTAPPGASLLLSVVLRPPDGVMDLCTMAVALSAADAIAAVGGFAPRLKWPNDLVWPGDGSAPDRKLAGILAEADAHPAAVVVVGIGINVTWPADLPGDLADIAVACNHVTPTPVDREDLLIALLEHLGPRYDALVAGDRSALLDTWRTRSATLGRPVRVVLGHTEVEGIATDITEDGHLVVQTTAGHHRTFAVGDVVHLR
jgi:BirA family transcriptional regulator, biotin operon repressor / biotin---[acetyl-CoA-carboxylase] ligase